MAGESQPTGTGENPLGLLDQQYRETADRILFEVVDPQIGPPDVAPNPDDVLPETR